MRTPALSLFPGSIYVRSERRPVTHAHRHTHLPFPSRITSLYKYSFITRSFSPHNALPINSPISSLAAGEAGFCAGDAQTLRLGQEQVLKPPTSGTRSASYIVVCLASQSPGCSLSEKWATRPQGREPRQRGGSGILALPLLPTLRGLQRGTTRPRACRLGVRDPGCSPFAWKGPSCICNGPWWLLRTPGQPGCRAQRPDDRVLVRDVGFGCLQFPQRSFCHDFTVPQTAHHHPSRLWKLRDASWAGMLEREHWQDGRYPSRLPLPARAPPCSLYLPRS